MKRAPAATLLVFGCAMLVGHADAAGDGVDAEREKLEAFRNKIESLRTAMAAARGQHSQIEQALRNADADIAGASRNLRRLRRLLEQDKRELMALQGDKQARSDDLSRQRDHLGEQLRAAYVAGRQEYLKVLLNQQDPSLIGRSLVYYDYFNKARSRSMNEIQAGLRELSHLEAAIEANTQRHQDHLREELENKKALEQGQAERRRVLARLEREIRENNAALSGLLEDQKQMETLLGSLRDFEPPAVDGERTKFSRRKGKLNWPVHGRITARYGSPRAAGRLKWQGIVFDARDGESVHAVAAGRVIFADWLRGYGFVLIIDHGDGFMSLYGHNQALYKNVGDSVDTREVVAAVGSSGGQVKPALYFELRHNGKPTNPSPWLTANGN